MKVLGSRIGKGAAVLLVGAASALSTGCADNESSLFIRGALIPDGSDCTVQATPSAPMIAQGTLDTGIRAEYTADLLLGNQIVRRGNTASLRTETSRIQLYEADVALLDAAGNELSRGDGSAAAFTVPISGFVDPGSGTEPGYGATSVLLIDSATGQSLDGQVTSSGLVQDIVASVIVRGRTLGGNEIESGEWRFPISICHCCLVFVPPEADDPATSGVDCSVREDTTATCTSRLGLDSAVDCRSVSSGSACYVP